MELQSDGLDIPFYTLSQLFQESTGPTAVAATNDPIGLALDQRLWGGKTLSALLAGQSELLVLGSWNTSTTGGAASAVESPPGTLTITGDGTNTGIAIQGIATVSGNTYCIQPTVAGVAVTLQVGTTSGGSQLFGATAQVGTGKFFFTATTATSYIKFARTPSGTTTVSAISCKLVPGHPAIQSTSSSFRPTYQSGWCRYDGSDDRHSLSGVTLGATGFVMLRRKLIQKTASTQVMFGAVGASGTDRIYFGVDTSGFPVGRIGNGAAMSVAADITGVDGTLGVWWDGSTAALLYNGVKSVSQAQVNAPTTTAVPHIGGYNNNGTLGSFCNFDCREPVYGSSAPNNSILSSIHRALMAA